MAKCKGEKKLAIMTMINNKHCNTGTSNLRTNTKWHKTKKSCLMAILFCCLRLATIPTYQLFQFPTAKSSPTSICGAGKLQRCTWSGLNFSLIMQVISKEVTCDSYSEVTRDTYLIYLISAGGSWGSASPIWSKHESIWILHLGNLGEVVGWRWVGQHITKFYYVNGVGMIPGFLRCAEQDCKHVQQQQPIQQLRSILSQRYIFLRRMTMFNKLNFSLCGKNNLPR